jgi:3',5'-cyclic AMP phosphodiesterase CpdA
MAYHMTRRSFLYRMAAGFFMLAGCRPKNVAWPVSGSDRGELRLAFYTDVHARKEWETPTALQHAANSINARTADLVIAGGDLITDGFQSTEPVAASRWDVYMQMHRAIDADLYPVIGNHDLVAANPKDGSSPADDPRRMFQDQTGLERTYYSFDAVGYHFIVLDSIHITRDDLQYHGMIEPEQMAWLKRDLAHTPKSTPIVVVTHIPLLTAFYSATQGGTFPAPQSRVVVNNLEVLEAFKDHNLPLVLQGHLHVEEMIRWQRTTFIVGGAICGKWWRGAWHGTKEGFNMITLGSNRFDWDYIEYGWQARRPTKK